MERVCGDLNYYWDRLHILSAQSGSPGSTISAGTPVRRGKLAVLRVTVTGNNITLDPAQFIAGIELRAMVTDTTSTAITMSNLMLNGGDIEYRDCILSGDTSGANFSVIFACGDTTLYRFIRTGKVIDILSMRPNPAQDEIFLDLHSVGAGAIRIDLVNALGAKVFSEDRSICSGNITISLDTHSLSQGVYLVRLSSAEGEAVQSFVKVK